MIILGIEYYKFFAKYGIIDHVYDTNFEIRNYIGFRVIRNADETERDQTN